MMTGDKKPVDASTMVNGVRSVRQMQLKDIASGKTRPSSRQQTRQANTLNYFIEKVDPIISDCVAHLLIHQPADVCAAMQEYFNFRHSHADMHNASAPDPVTETAGDRPKPRRDQKIYLATEVGPIMARVINRIARKRPLDVLGFLCTEMVQIAMEESERKLQQPPIPSETPTSVRKKLSTAIELADTLKSPIPAVVPPSSARKKIASAIELDGQIEESMESMVISEAPTQATQKENQAEAAVLMQGTAEPREVAQLAEAAAAESSEQEMSKSLEPDPVEAPSTVPEPQPEPEPEPEPAPEPAPEGEKDAPTPEPAAVGTTDNADGVPAEAKAESEPKPHAEPVPPNDPQLSAPAPVSAVEEPTPAAAPAAAPTPEPEPQPMKNIHIAIIGMGGAGKTTIVNAITGNFDKKAKPSLGFKPCEMMADDNTKVTLYDLGGGKSIRSIWSGYYHDIHALMYVIDASAEPDMLSESLNLYRETLNHPMLEGKPLLIVANKQDVEVALSSDALQQRLELSTDDEDVKFKIAPTTALVRELPDGAEVDDRQADPRINTGVDWLVLSAQNHYDALHARVQADTAVKSAADAKKRQEKERRVLKNRVAMAFQDQIDPTLLPPDLPEPEAGFGESEGVEFLAAEVDVEVNDLHPAAVKLAGMVGYQRLALQIVGALRAPVSKKRTPMEWEDICSMVEGLRAELGL